MTAYFSLPMCEAETRILASGSEWITRAGTNAMWPSAARFRLDGDGTSRGGSGSCLVGQEGAY